MKKIILPFLFYILTTFTFNSSYGQTVTETKARKVAINFIDAKYSDKSESEYSLIMLKNFPNINPIQSQLYIFNLSSGGFIIISGEETAVPVIAYSDNGEFPISNVNPNIKSWLDNYIEQINYYRENNSLSSPKIKAEWTYLTNNIGSNPYQSSKAISPFLRSIWGQDGNYDDMCPTNSQGTALVGCVATAMAQVIYYYRYPTTGNGYYSYYASGFGTQSVNFGNSTYNYDEMAYDATTPMYEVAELSYHCGVSVGMYYGITGSGANTYDVDDALEDYFLYSTTASYKSKQMYSTSAWATMLRDNIDDYHPVIYSGSGTSGAGHAFICDGYDGSDYFHFDWGWDGYANGYYYLNALNPAGADFNSWQAAVFNIYPPTSSYPYGCSGNTTLTHTHGSIEDGSGPASDYEANADCSWLISPAAQCAYFKINFEEIDIATDDQVIIYEGPNDTYPIIGTYNGTTLPSEITANSSEVFIHFTSNSSNNGKGFLLNYVGKVPLSCFGVSTLTADTDTFDDGSGSNHYGNSSFCRWYIQPPNASSITLHFLAFDIEANYDYVKVIDAASGTTMGEYSGTNIPSSITINSNNMTIMFQSNSSYTGQGFEAFYTITTGINDNPEGVSMRFYPNPTSDFLHVIPGTINSSGIIVIYDFSGQKILQKEFTDANMITIPVNKFSAGIYQIGLLSEKGNIWQKFMIE